MRRSLETMIGMKQAEHGSHGYYRLHEKIALVSLLTKEMRKRQQQPSAASPAKKRLGICSMHIDA